MKKPESLRKKLTITYVLLIVIPFASLSLILSWLTFQSQKKAAVTLQAEVMKRAVNEILLVSQGYQARFSFIARGAEILDVGRDKQRHLIALLQSVKDESATDILQEVALLDGQGMELARVSRTEAVAEDDLQSWAGSEEFIRTEKMRATYYGPVVFDQNTLEPMMNLAVPILDLRTGDLEGMIVGRLRLRQVWDKIVSRMVGLSGVLYITDSSGKVIAHPNPSVVFRVTRVLPDREPGVHVGMLGDPVILSSDDFRLGNQPFRIVAETPLAESLSLSRKTLFVSLFMLELFLLFAVGFGVFMVSRIASPIEALAYTAAAISKGDYYNKAEEQGYLEISALAKAFNDMTSQLVGTITELRRTEQKLIASKDVMQKMVLDRTIELQRTNEDLEEEIVRRSRTEDVLRRYSQIVNASHDYISFVSRNYRYLAVNDSYLSALGRTRSDVVSRHVQEIWGYKVFEEEIKKKFDTAFEGRKVQYELWLEIGRMGRRFYEVAMTPFQEVGAEIDGVVVNIRDATERWNLEKNLRQSEKMKAVGTLASGIAHDFNNVLHNIFGCARVAQQSLDKDSNAYYWLGRLQQVGERAAHLIRQIQSFSRQPEPVKIPLDLQSMIHEVLRLQELTLPKNIRVDLDLGSCRKVLADATQMHQVLANLFTNAVHAMSPQGGTLSVALQEMEIDDSARAADERQVPKAGRYARVTVSDTGHGMDKELAERIFEPFFTTKSFGKGTGLGLSISQGIVVAHGGVMTVWSEPGRGAAFQVWLPLTESVVDNRPVHEETGPRVVSGRILYVDDEEESVDVWKNALEKEGFEVAAAGNGREALRLYEQDTGGFDLVITDQRMPGMTGVELAEKLKSMGVTDPVILVTGWRDELSGDAVKRNVVQALLSKPINMEELLKVIEGLKA